MRRKQHDIFNYRNTSDNPAADHQPGAVLECRKKALTETQRGYRGFLFGVLAYLITDMLWGILESYRLTPILYADAAVHFIAMALAVMLWTRYVILYLGQKNAFGAFLSWAGRLFLCFEVVVVIVNFFRPILFWFDGSGTYYVGIARYRYMKTLCLMI